MIVHVLVAGHALCGKPGLPQTWPADEQWISISDPRAPRQASCEQCLQNLKLKRPLDAKVKS